MQAPITAVFIIVIALAVGAIFHIKVSQDSMHQLRRTLHTGLIYAFDNNDAETVSLLSSQKPCEDLLDPLCSIKNRRHTKKLIRYLSARKQSADEKKKRELEEVKEKERQKAEAQIWNLEYTDAIGQPPDPNGRITRWDTNHFVAHAWSVNGQKIASCPQRIRVDDEVYHYQDRQAFMPDEDYTDFTGKEDQVILQTCDAQSSAIMLLRYEKEESEEDA